VTGARWWRRLSILLLLIALVTALTVIPLELRIEGTGTLRPEQRRGVFAPEAGTIVDVRVGNGTPVRAGQTLAVLNNPEISVWQDHLAHDLSNAEKSLRIREAERADRSISAQRRIQLDGEIVQYREQVASLRRQVELMEERVADMTLRAPIDGVVATWDAERQLLNRTVVQGDLLLLVNDDSQSWQIEIQVPERDSGDVLQAWRARPAGARGLPVDYILATHPERRYRGWLTAIENRAEPLGQEQVVYVTLVPDEEDPPPLRDGAEVRAKIRCGSRPIGLIWARDVIRFFQSRILF
jgi:multidrug efflux pump subunit AcrA (membrane-fusion protein)